jgi:hypothetical protein
MPPRKQDFEVELHHQFAQARRFGKSYVNVNSGDLHRSVGGYPRRAHRMSLCCRVMYRAMDAWDLILFTPPEEVGGSVTIRFALPR